MHLSVRNLDLPQAAMAATLLLAKAAVGAENEASPQPSPPDAKPQAEETVFDHTCTSFEIPLDGAPLPALSLDDQMHAARIQPPSHFRPGTTKLHLLVNEEGRVVRARVSASHGDPRMDEAVLRAVEHWHFKPRYLDAKAVCAWGSYAVTFELKDEEAPDAPTPNTPPRDHP